MTLQELMTNIKDTRGQNQHVIRSKDTRIGIRRVWDKSETREERELCIFKELGSKWTQEKSKEHLDPNDSNRELCLQSKDKEERHANMKNSRFWESTENPLKEWRIASAVFYMENEKCNSAKRVRIIQQNLGWENKTKDFGSDPHEGTSRSKC